MPQLQSNYSDTVSSLLDSLTGGNPTIKKFIMDYLSDPTAIGMPRYGGKLLPQNVYSILGNPKAEVTLTKILNPDEAVGAMRVGEKTIPDMRVHRNEISDWIRAALHEY